MKTDLHDHYSLYSGIIVLSALLTLAQALAARYVNEVEVDLSVLWLSIIAQLSLAVTMIFYKRVLDVQTHQVFEQSSAVKQGLEKFNDGPLFFGAAGAILLVVVLADTVNNDFLYSLDTGAPVRDPGLELATIYLQLVFSLFMSVFAAITYCIDSKALQKYQWASLQLTTYGGKTQDPVAFSEKNRDVRVDRELAAVC